MNLENYLHNGSFQIALTGHFVMTKAFLTIKFHEHSSKFSKAPLTSLMAYNTSKAKYFMKLTHIYIYMLFSPKVSCGLLDVLMIANIYWSTNPFLFKYN